MVKFIKIRNKLDGKLESVELLNMEQVRHTYYDKEKRCIIFKWAGILRGQSYAKIEVGTPGMYILTDKNNSWEQVLFYELVHALFGEVCDE